MARRDSARPPSRLENNPLRFFGPEGPFRDPAPRLSGGSGFIASSDHLATHTSYACVWAKEKTLG